MWKDCVYVSYAAFYFAKAKWLFASRYFVLLIKYVNLKRWGHREVFDHDINQFEEMVE